MNREELKRRPPGESKQRSSREATMLTSDIRVFDFIVGLD